MAIKTLKHTCENCESDYKIVYDDEVVADQPQFCPICAEMIVDKDGEDCEDDF
jgi:hypothetical protein